MQKTHTSDAGLDEPRHAPRHDEIAQCAKELWLQYGQPTDRDLAIWLEAEHRLFAASHSSPDVKTRRTGSSAKAPTKSTHR